MYYSNFLSPLLHDKMDAVNHIDISMETLQTALVNVIKAERSIKNVQMNSSYINLSKKESQLVTNTDINNTLKILSEMRRIDITIDNNITDSQPHIPTIIVTSLVDASSFNDIIPANVEDQLFRFK